MHKPHYPRSGLVSKEKIRYRAAKKRHAYFFIFILLLFTVVGSLLYDGAVFGMLGTASGEKISNAQPVKKERLAERNTVGAYIESNVARAAGVGRIKDSTTQGKLLARRAALTDARRKLIVLRKELLGNSRFKSGSVSGYLPGWSQKITIERTDGNLYFLELEMRIEELTRKDFNEHDFLEK